MVEARGGILVDLNGLPLPPSENHLYVNVRRVGRVKGPDYRRYEEAFYFWSLKNQKAIIAAIIALDGTKELSLRISFRFLRERLYTKKNAIKKMDVTNRLKAFIDLLSLHLKIDDSRFFNVYCEKVEHLKEEALIQISKTSEKLQ